MIAELERRRGDVGSRMIRSIFIGGGTPSLWEATHLGRVLDALSSALSISADCEVTVEANPSSLDFARAEALASVGVNRLSIGVQSLRQHQLQFLGRIHTPAQGRSAVQAAVDSRIQRVSADLIFGLPSQPTAEPVADALELIDLGIDHLSAYSLTIETGTPFGARAKAATLPLAIDDDVADTYCAIEHELISRGLDHYEISNYARAGARSRHNMGYWVGSDYLGLGCAAWGTLSSDAGSRRYRNTPSPARYLEFATTWKDADLDRASTELPQSDLEALCPESRFMERLMLGLRLSDGIDIARQVEELGATWTADQAAARTRLLASGALELTGTRTRIAPAYWLVADSILAQLV